MNRFIVGALALLMAATASARVTDPVNGDIVDTVDMDQAYTVFNAACENRGPDQMVDLAVFDYSEATTYVNHHECRPDDTTGMRIDWAQNFELFNQHDGTKHVKVRVYTFVRAQ